MSASTTLREAQSPRRARSALALAGSLLFLGCMAANLWGEETLCTRTVKLLEEGKETVRIVCFGDSITGIYYHSGAARAWCDMVGIGLQRAYPQAKIEMINAGISSQTTAHALQRIQKDVLDRKPTLVVAAFGMNDVRVNEKRGIKPLPMQQAHDNQTQIVKLCKAAGAEVVLCTPTTVYHGFDEWPFETLAPYAEMVRQVAAAEKVPVADSYRTFENLRAKDATAWMVTMSEWIHPNMNGHKVIAQEIIRAATGKSVALADVPAPVPGIPFTLAKLAKGEPVTVIAMEPFDKLILPALRALYPNAEAAVTAIAVPDPALAKILESVAGIRAAKADLVVMVVPANATEKDEEWFIRNYSNVFGSATSYVTREFDCVGILPAVLMPELSAAQRRQQDLARMVIRGHDLDPVERKAGDQATPEEILTRWLQQQMPKTAAGGAAP